ncbi:olfactory receptor 11A1-like [Pyxicephalus adspersus]
MEKQIVWSKNLDNQTVQEFILLVFEITRDIRFLFFSTLLLIYLAILAGNLLVITMVHRAVNLQTPMYFLLGHLSFAEVLFTTNIVPNMLNTVLCNGGLITLEGCITQFFMFSSSTTAECLLLSIMSYDRFLAICSPLQYSSLMTQHLCLKLVCSSWLTGIVISLPAAILISKLHFCGSNVIDHFFCDLAPILQLSCSDTTFLEMEDLILSFPVLVFPLIFIVVTYIRIIFVICRIPTSSGKQKAFSTCSSHLLVVCTYYGTLIIVYMTPSVDHSVSKLLALLYIVGTPLLNPIIYSLRSREIRDSLKKLRSLL